jgi:hypothetical protein
MRRRRLNPDVFLSHASKDATLAKSLKRLLEKTLKVEVFLSSEPGAIRVGRQDFHEIISNLLAAKVCVALLTPSSAHLSSWVLFEVGGSYLLAEHDSSHRKLVTVSAYGLDAQDAPAPLNELEIYSLANRDMLECAIGQIAEHLGKEPGRDKDLEQEVTREAGRGSLDWKHVTSSLVGERQGSSPLSLDSLLEEAQTSVFCAGFNLNWIATTPDALGRLRNWLKEKPKEDATRSRIIQLLIADKQTADFFEEKGFVQPKYYSDLKTSIDKLLDWRTECIRDGVERDQIEIKTTSEGPVAFPLGLTVLAIDADDRKRGQLVLTPNIRPESEERPQFWVSRARRPHERVFLYYWSTYSRFFKDGKDLTIVGGKRK